MWILGLKGLRNILTAPQWGKRQKKYRQAKQAKREQIKHCILQQKGTDLKNFTIICFKEDKFQNSKRVSP